MWIFPCGIRVFWKIQVKQLFISQHVPSYIPRALYQTVCYIYSHARLTRIHRYRRLHGTNAISPDYRCLSAGDGSFRRFAHAQIDCTPELPYSSAYRRVSKARYYIKSNTSIIEHYRSTFSSIIITIITVHY